MKKNIVKIIIALAVLVLLGAGTYLLMRPSKSAETDNTAQTTPAPVYTLYETDIANMQSAVIKSETTDITVSRIGEDWTVNNLPAEDIDTSKTKSLAETIAKITASALIDEDGADLGEYGLDKPSAEITVNKNDGTSDKILIGGTSPSDGSRFAKSSLSDTVYTVSSYKLESLENPISYYTEFTRFSMQDTSAVSEIKIERSDMTIDFVKDNSENQNGYYDSWLIKSPVSTSANSDYISNTILQNIGKMTLSAPLDGGDFGFDRPAAKLTLTVTQYDEEKKENKEPYTESFIIGKSSEGSTYVSYKGKAYAVDTEMLDFINMPLINTVSKVQSLVNISSVARVEVTYGGAVHAIDITHSGDDGKDMTFTLNGSEIGESDAKKLYQELIGVMVDGIYANQPQGETIMSITFKGYNGAEDTTVEYKAVSDLDCAMVKNGTAQFTVKRSVINTLMNTVNSYIK